MVCPIPGYDLDVWKCCKPSADFNGLPGGNQIDYPVALKINHDRPIGEPFAEREVIHANLFYRSFIHNGRHFF